MSGEPVREGKIPRPWLLSTETAPGPPVHVASCMACSEESGGADNWDGPQVWCLRHASETGHTLFHAAGTSFLRARVQEVP